MTKKKNEKLAEAMKGNQNAVGNNGGAPSKYKKEYCEQIIEFFDIDPYREIELDKGRVQRIANKLPTFERFASNIGVVVNTLRNWADEFPEFLKAYNECEQLQKEILVQNGLIGGYQNNFAVFVAQNFTDMKVKQEIDNKSSDGSMSPKKIERVIIDVKNTDS